MDRLRGRSATVVAVVGMLVVSAACASGSGALSEPTTTGPASATSLPASTTTSTTTTSTTTTSTTTPTTTTPTTTTPSTTTPSTTTPSTTTPSTTTTSTTVPEAAPTFDATSVTFLQLAREVPAASLSVWRDGAPVLQLASGSDRSGEPVTGQTPMVIASVSKLITALTVARLAAADVVDVEAPVPWDEMGLVTHPDWADVTARELLDHTSGMPVARQTWLDDPGSCATPLAALLARPPTRERGEWRYSNGNYCALGLLIEAATGARYDVTGTWLVFGPAGVEGPRLTVDGPAPGDAPHRADLSRFDRLGAAGSWLAGTDHVAAVLAGVSGDDFATLRWPGIFFDQYGWGHTGTLRGAVSCAWVLEGGRTAVSATLSGERPSTGGGVCDALLPALGDDLGLTGPTGLPLGTPERTPP